MSNEFARMLRVLIYFINKIKFLLLNLQETLDKMQERIEMTQWNDESDPQMMKKLKDNLNAGLKK